MNALYCLYIVFLLALGGAADGFAIAKHRVQSFMQKGRF